MKGQFSGILLVLISATCISLASANACAGQYWGSVANPEVCYKYYYCILTVANERTCPDGQIFSSEVSECVRGDQETCEIWVETTEAPTTEAPTTEAPTTEAPTTEAPTEPPTTEAPTTEAPTTEGPAPSNPCQGQYFGNVANPNFCYRYYLCVLTVASERTCPAGNVFSSEASQCVPGDQDTCEIFGETTTTEATTEGTTEAVTTEGATSTQPETTALPPVDLDAICRGLFFAARPHPHNMVQFVGCIRSSGVIFTCYDSEIFNPATNECTNINTPMTTDAPPSTVTFTYLTTHEPESSSWSSATDEPTTYSSTALTTEQTITDSSTYPTTEQTTQAPGFTELCRGRFLELVEHPDSCSLMILCYDEMYFVQRCPEHEIFDVTIQSCRAGDPFSCKFDSDTTQIPDTTVLENPCEGVQAGSKPHEGDCTRYYQCLLGRPVLRACDEGEIFSRDDEVCVLGDQETCLAL